MNKNQWNKLIVGSDVERLDKWIAKNFYLPRNKAQEHIRSHYVKRNGILVEKINLILKENDEIEIFYVDKVDENYSPKPENIELDIIFEDDDLVIINKPAGMVVHPASSNFSGTLVNALLHRFNSLSDKNGINRPGIVHRLDKDTSGLIIVAKNNQAHTYLSKQLHDHKINREYYAITDGKIKNKIMHVNLPIGRSLIDRKKMEVTKIHSRPAITHIYEVESKLKNSLVKCKLETGRTHQIRVHLAYLKTPILNDPVYSKIINPLHGQYLHAFKLEFIHPNGKEMLFECNPPKYFWDMWNSL